ncbi:MAG: DUF760 domain-containing protein [Cyanobacteria bacterium J06642_2]
MTDSNPNPTNYLPGFEGTQAPGPDNELWQYMQSQAPETFQNIAKSSSPEVMEILSHNIRSLVGNLPPDQFGVQIVTNRENLARMLSGAMMGGYFLKTLEQRLALEQAMAGKTPPSLSEADDNTESR